MHPISVYNNKHSLILHLLGSEEISNGIYETWIYTGLDVSRLVETHHYVHLIFITNNAFKI